MQQGIACEIISWHQVQCLARDLAFRIRADGFVPDILVAIGRGGWIPGRLLSDYMGNLNLTELKVEHYTGTHKQSVARVRYPLKADLTAQRVLVIDDVTDTGGSFEVALEHIRGDGEAREIRTGVLHHKRTSPYVPDYFADEVVDWRWIIYPWAIMEDLSGLIDAMVAPPADPQTLAERLRQDHGIGVDLDTLRDVLELMRGEEGPRRNSQGPC